MVSSMNSFVESLSSSANRSTTGVRWNAALPTQSARVERCRSIPDRARIWACLYNGKWSAYLPTKTWAISASVGSAPSMRCAGAGIWVTPSVQARQAYLGRMVTMTRSWAGTISNRSVRSSPTLCIRPQPQGHSRLSGSTTFSIRGRSAGRLPRLRLTHARFGRDAGGDDHIGDGLDQRH